MCFRDADDKVVRWTGSATDVTEGKRAEEPCAPPRSATRRRWKAPMPATGLDLVTDEMFVSERAREMLALPAGALPQRARRSWRSCRCPR